MEVPDESFEVKKPKRRRHRIIDSDNGVRNHSKSAPVAVDSSFPAAHLVQGLKDALAEHPLSLMEQESLEVTERTHPFHFEHEGESEFLQLARNASALANTEEVFGHQMFDLLTLFRTSHVPLSQKQQVLYCMFLKATEGGGTASITSFPAFLVYAKKFFPPTAMQDVSILCGQRLNEISQEPTASTPPQEAASESNLSPRESLSPRERKKPRRGTSLKNFFREKLAEGESPARVMVDMSNLNEKEPTSPAGPASASTRVPVARASTDRRASQMSLKRMGSRSQLFAPEDVLQPLFEDQVSTLADWTLVDPPEPAQHHLHLLTRLWDFRYESGGYDPGELANIVSIDHYWQDEPIYENNFNGKTLYNFISSDPADVVIVSIACANEKAGKMVIVITYRETLQLRSPPECRFRDILRAVNGMLQPKSPYNFVRCKDSGLDDQLLRFENGNRVRNYKFGILYCKAGQTDENDMFGNNEPSDDYTMFLEWIGNRIPLKGWKKFRGGLDVNENTTGAESIFTIHAGFEIMFHVSTMLPFYPSDTQQLERKRHLGNDVVVIVYKEGDQKFDPSCIHSEFNHVFIVIQRVSPAEELDGQPTFRIEIGHKGDIPSPPLPLLSQDNLYHLDESFRRVLLTKMVNAERMAMRSKQFSLKLRRTRQYLLKNIHETFMGK